MMHCRHVAWRELHIHLMLGILIHQGAVDNMRQDEALASSRFYPKVTKKKYANRRCANLIHCKSNNFLTVVVM